MQINETKNFGSKNEQRQYRIKDIVLKVAQTERPWSMYADVCESGWASLESC